MFLLLFCFGVVSLCFSDRRAGLLGYLCFSVFSLCHCLLRFLCVSAICNLFGVLSSLWMWKPGADRLRGNQSNKQEEARLPDNVFEQTPRICFGLLGFFGTFGIFQRQSEQLAGRSSLARQRV